MAHNNAVTVRLLQAQDTSGTAAKAFIAEGGTAEVFTINFSNAPTAGQSFCQSTISSAGLIDNWQAWFKIAGVGSAPTAQTGYTLAEIDIAGWADTTLAAKMAAALNSEVTCSYNTTTKILTITNTNTGWVNAPVDVNTGSTITVSNLGADASQFTYTATATGTTSNPPIVEIDALLGKGLDVANGYNTIAVQMTTNATLLVGANLLFYVQKTLREDLPLGLLF
jgi:hypothetical protein